jgi:uncharacterized protein YndB with AHSA1/START domain
MIKIEHSMLINRPIEEVFAFATDIDKLPQWNTLIVEAKKTTDGPMDVGTKIEIVNRLLGRQMKNTYEVTQFEQNKLYD